MLVGFQEKLASVLVILNFIFCQFSDGFQDFHCFLIFGQADVLLN